MKTEVDYRHYLGKKIRLEGQLNNEKEQPSVKTVQRTLIRNEFVTWIMGEQYYGCTYFAPPLGHSQNW